MKLTAIKLLLFTISLSAVFSNLKAQSFCLQLNEVSNNASTYVVDIEMYSDEEFNLGSARLNIITTPGAVEIPTISNSNLLEPNYEALAISEIEAGLYSIDINLSEAPGVQIKPLPTTTFIARLEFPIIDQTLMADGFQWQYDGTQLETFVLLEDNSTLLLAVDTACIVGIDQPTMVANEICETATDLDVGVFTDPGPTNGLSGVQDLCFGNGPVNDASWYRYTATESGQLTLNSSINSALPNTRVSVFTGTCDSLFCFASDDDSGDGFTSLISFLMVENETYYIQWDDRWSADSFDFEVSFIATDTDTDGDGITDIEDNCSELSNSDQLDIDGDNIGDVCDEDIDGDGFLNIKDCSPLDADVFVGAVCDDNDETTALDQIQPDCGCLGRLIPENNVCSGAIAIGEGLHSDPGPFSGEGASNNCELEATNASWYLYTPSQSGLTTISTGFNPELPDTRVSVYTGSCEELNCLASNDDGGPGFTTLLSFVTTEGESYLLEWDDRWESEAFDFEITTEPAIFGCNQPLACNYDEEVTIFDLSCEFAFGCDECIGEGSTGSVLDNPEIGDACDDGDEATTNDIVVSCGVCQGELNGCMDIDACNFDVLAVIDNSSCIYAIGCDVCDGLGGIINNPEEGDICDDGNSMTINDMIQADCSCQGTMNNSNCPTDINGDGTTNGLDFGIFLGNFGLICDTGNCPTDINGDGITDGLDFGIFLGNFDLDCVTPCPTDLNSDGVTDGLDFGIFLGNFEISCGDGICPADFDGSGFVDGEDFAIFLGNFGLTCN